MHWHLVSPKPGWTTNVCLFQKRLQLVLQPHVITLNWYFRRATVHSRRCSPSGTKLRVNCRATSRFTKRAASGKSLLRPRRPRLHCACARCRVPDIPQKLRRTSLNCGNCGLCQFFLGIWNESSILCPRHSSSNGTLPSAPPAPCSTSRDRVFCPRKRWPALETAAGPR